MCVRRRARTGVTVCAPCNNAAKARVSARRRKAALDEARRRALVTYESAGDFAVSRYAYPEAMRQYESALQQADLAPDDACRLFQKVAAAFFYGREPERAQLWYKRALDTYRRAGDAAGDARSVGMLLLRLTRQYWLNAETLAALPLIREAMRYASLARDERFAARASLAMAHYLILLGRHREAEQSFKDSAPVRPDDAPEMKSVSQAQRGILYAAKGDRQEAYRYLETAVTTAKEIPDGYLATAFWDDFGIWAMALGDLATAQVCRERALFVARERHIAWRIAYLSLRYADLLVELEQYDAARRLVLDALTYDIKTPCVTILLASVGMRLARLLDDEGLMRRCADEHAIELAFRSGESARIGPVVSAFVRANLAVGEQSIKQNAKKLLRRGINALSSADHAYDLLIDAALYGDADSQAAAKALLEERAALPNSSIAQAFMKLFNAALAWQDGDKERQRLWARRAAVAFGSVGLQSQKSFALSFAGKDASAQGKAPVFRSMLGDITTLSKREADVADLVLRGLTNREIARTLWITENTVESHMTSIMNRLGIRSRHQLVDHLSSGR